MAEPNTLVTRHVPIDSVKPYHANARIGNVDVIRESLRINGQYRPIVVWKSTDEILAGNHTWKAAKAERWKKIYASFVDCDEETAKRINLVDNRAAELGAYDQNALVQLLEGLPDLAGTGWEDDELSKLLGESTPEIRPQLGDPEYKIILECESEGHQAELLQRFEQEGLRYQAVTI